MFRLTIGVFLIWFLFVHPSAEVFAGQMPVVMQEPSPTPEIQVTVIVPTEVPYYRTETIDGQVVRYEYVISAGDVVVSGLLLFLIFSLWGLGGIFYLNGERK